MRVFPIAAALVTVGALAVPAGAATPHPSTCTAVAQGAVVPANPGGLAATAAVVTYGAEVTCPSDPLTTGPVEYLYSGDMTVFVVTGSGAGLCGVGGYFPSAQLMSVHSTCVVPVSDSRRLEPLYVQVWWATHPPYTCCGSHRVPIQPVGAG